MTEIITKILSNLDKINQKYQGMEKAYKIRDYTTLCYEKLKKKVPGGSELVVELRQALHTRLDYAKKKKGEEDRQRSSYLRSSVESVFKADSQGEWENTDPPAHRRNRGSRLPFRENAD